MKKIFFGIILLSFFLISCGNNLKWEDNLQAALEKAKQENKAVLVNFTGSDWCIWCKRLSDEVFTQSDFKTYADKNLILVMIDFPRDKEQSQETKMYNNQLAQQYGVKGFPTILLFNSSGNLVLTTGYLPGGPQNYISHLQAKL